MDTKEATSKLEEAFQKWVTSEDFRKIERFIRAFHNYSLDRKSVV